MSGYIGTQPVPQATQTRDSFTATASQTSFATAGYTPGFLDVYLNGVKLAAADYTATNSSDVVLTVGAALNDLVDVVAFTTFESSSQTFVGTVTATAFAGDGSALTGVNAHKPVAVTGTTPSLDVGSYNFFDSGALTADTTVSFASVPTNARWSYSFSPIIASGAWDVSTAVYKQTFSVAAQESTPYGLFFKPDGLKMYVIGTTGDDVNEYDLSTAWDVSTAVFLQLFSVAVQETQPWGMALSTDGLYMYVIGPGSDAVNQYTLSTAWDVSSATYTRAFSVATQDVTPSEVFFKPDGLKMYVLGWTGDDVNEYTLSTAWDVSTAVYLQTFSVAAQEITPYGLFFKPDGLKMYVSGPTGDSVYEYDLSTAWNVSTAVYLQARYVGVETLNPGGVFFKPDGLKMYIAGLSAGVGEYDVGTPTSITLPASVVGTPSATAAGDQVTYEFVTADSGTTVTLIAEEVISQ